MAQGWPTERAFSAPDTPITQQVDFHAWLALLSCLVLHFWRTMRPSWTHMMVALGDPAAGGFLQTVRLAQGSLVTETFVLQKASFGIGDERRVNTIRSSRAFACNFAQASTKSLSILSNSVPVSYSLTSYTRLSNTLFNSPSTDAATRESGPRPRPYGLFGDKLPFSTIVPSPSRERGELSCCFIQAVVQSGQRNAEAKLAVIERDQVMCVCHNKSK